MCPFSRQEGEKCNRITLIFHRHIAFDSIHTHTLSENLFSRGKYTTGRRLQLKFVQHSRTTETFPKISKFLCIYSSKSILSLSWLNRWPNFHGVVWFSKFGLRLQMDDTYRIHGKPYPSIWRKDCGWFSEAYRVLLHGVRKKFSGARKA